MAAVMQQQRAMLAGKNAPGSFQKAALGPAHYQLPLTPLAAPLMPVPSDWTITREGRA
jgi:hypothetical protein